MRRIVYRLIIVLSIFYMASSAALAQPMRIAVGAASVSSLPTWVAHDGGYFAREGVPAELIYIRGGRKRCPRW
jgi:ABC-type nitrate/sulfonate/bicarbonate transport system substrate-binding protein